MYQQPQGTYHSSESLKRFSSNNPFRPQFNVPQHSNPSNSSIRSSNAAFDDWVEKNKKFIDESEDEDEELNTDTIVNFYGNSVSPEKKEFERPQFPVRPTRTGSDSSVNSAPQMERKMSSNNPFASAMNEPNSYVHHREPPPPPSGPQLRPIQTPPARPPKQKTSTVAPPSYEEAAGPEASRSSEYPREKSNSTSSGSSSSRQYNNNTNSNSNSKDHSNTHHRSNDSHNNDPSKPRRTRSASEHVSKSSSTSHRRHHNSSSHRSSGDRNRDRDRDGDREKDRERRSRKSPSKKTTQPVKSKNLDTIDKLDVTAFFGGGFHHDGPFDACTPHRNKNVKAAPVSAFPADGPNNSIKGFGNKDKHSHLDMAFGNFDVDQNEIVGKKTSGNKDAPQNGTSIKLSEVDQTSSLYIPKHNPSVINFDAKQKALPVHGETTPGLGSSTFVDGAPAPKAVSNDEYLNPPNVLGGGLGRKKSLVQRLRKNSGSENTSRRGSNDNQIEQTYSDEPIESPGNSLLRRVKSLKVGRK